MTLLTQRPEITSRQIHLGPGPASIWSAAQAWAVLADSLHVEAAGFLSVTTGLADQAWRSRAAAQMATVAALYADVLHATAAGAEQTAIHTTEIAAAFETVKAAVVPPADVEDNREKYAKLVLSDRMRQNAAAISLIEAEYDEMWAQNEAAVTAYHETVSVETGQLGPWPQPPYASLDETRAKSSPSVHGRSRPRTPVSDVSEDGFHDVTFIDSGTDSTSAGEVTESWIGSTADTGTDTGSGNANFGNIGGGNHEHFNVGITNNGFTDLGSGNLGAFNIGFGNLGDYKVSDFLNSGRFFSDILNVAAGTRRTSGIGSGTTGFFNSRTDSPGIASTATRHSGIANSGESDAGAANPGTDSSSIADQRDHNADAYNQRDKRPEVLTLQMV